MNQLTRRCSRPGFALLDARLGGRLLSGRVVSQRSAKWES